MPAVLGNWAVLNIIIFCSSWGLCPRKVPGSFCTKIKDHAAATGSKHYSQLTKDLLTENTVTAREKHYSQLTKDLLTENTVTAREKHYSQLTKDLLTENTVTAREKTL